MRVLIAGIDGYLGWSLAVYLSARGYEVSGIDTFHRRHWVQEVGGDSVVPIGTMDDRCRALRRVHDRWVPFTALDLCDTERLIEVLETTRPEAIVHLAEQPSAPYSMIDVGHAVETQTNNVMGTLSLLFAVRDTCPRAHLIKLGTMGEYGTPGVKIMEGHFNVNIGGRKARMLFPRQAGSWYHQSKVHDTHNVEMACRLWGLRATDVMQGVVYGTRRDDSDHPPGLATRLDVDGCFGTVINRFCAQAVIGEPLTPYGSGTQTRGYLPMRDVMQCLRIALDNPPLGGEYRTFNQFDRTHSVMELAEAVAREGRSLGLQPTIQLVANPRVEAEHHFYEAKAEALRDLGYEPHGDLAGEIRAMLGDMLPHTDRIGRVKRALAPSAAWDPRCSPAG